MKRIVFVVFVVIAAVAWQALSSMSSSAQPERGSDEPIDIAELGLSDIELEDLSAIADDMGISLEQAIARYSWNQSFAEMVSLVRATAEGSFASAEIVDSSTAWVSFTSDPPERALEALDAFVAEHPNVAVRVLADAAVNESDLEAMIEAAHFAVLGHDAVADASTVFDTDAEELTTTVALERSADDQVVDELSDVATAAINEAGLRHLLEAVDVVVLVSEAGELGGLDAGNQHLGGELLNGIGCTSGFVVIQDGTGTLGVSTAAHCGNNGATDDGIALTFRGEHFGNNGDVQWHTGPQPRPSDFYAGDANNTEVNRRTVTELGAPVVGQSLCKNGRTNHRQCQEVRRLHVCRENACNMVQMGARLAAPGDSGGPIYWNTTAYGLHSGWQHDPWPFDRDYFSRADRLPNALGVHIAK
jgi:streptogrisin C